MQDLKRTFENQRYRIATALPMFTVGSESVKAQRLTQHAIDRHYCDQRSMLAGTCFKNWKKNRKAPLWACQSAADLLLETDYLPLGFDLTCLLTLLAKNSGVVGVSDLVDSLPSRFQNADIERPLNEVNIIRGLGPNGTNML